jgi:hypothetical protein
VSDVVGAKGGRPVDDVTINLDHDVALVLFEMLSRWSVDDQPLAVQDVSEEHALLKVLGPLESSLVEPFRADYRELLERSRATLRHRHGEI